MRASAVLLGLVSSASAASLAFFGHDTPVESRGDLKVPGKSPLEFCPADHSKDVLVIKSVELSPNPPLAGTELVIKASGEVGSTIAQGAYVNLQVKYGLIRLITTTADLCEQVENVDIKCPIEKGPLEIVKSVELPREIPPGKYTVLADVYTVDDEPITCLTATVVFERPTSITIEL